MKRLLAWTMLFGCAAVGGAASSSAPSAPDATAQGAYIFAYFQEPGTQGIYLALSRDGYTFSPLNDGQPWVKPEQPGEVMRDVFITHDPNGGGFRMVWTWAWKGNSLGTASSPDLMTWSPQQEVPIMQDFPTVRNTWAPETYWDAKSKEWLLIWSSSLADQPEGLRIWSARTKDFKTFTKPAMFFDRGFPVIDATMLHADFKGQNKWFFVFKDQTLDPLRYAVRWTSGPTVDGPWGELSGPITESWSEGPSVVQIGDKYVVYYDHYRAPRARYEGVETTDWIHWTSVDDTMHFPDHAKHGSFFRVSEAEAEKLLARHDSVLAAR
jgi:hypothetical protein